MRTEKNRYATKKEGKTEVYPFRTAEDIRNVVQWFIDNKEYDGYLTTMFGLLLGRRISDIIMYKWTDFFFKNGIRRETVAVREQKTGKTIEVPLSDSVFESIDMYCKMKNITLDKIEDDYIFHTDFKTRWIERKNDPMYDLNDIDAWCIALNKNISDKRKNGIMDSFVKQKRFKTLGEYLYYNVEYLDIIKWQEDKYRKLLLKAVKSNSITYRVSTHSLRKTWGMWIMKENPFDPMCIYSIQRLLGHASVQETIKYIGMTQEKDSNYVHAHGKVMKSIMDGETDVLANNSPVVSLKNEDFRAIIMFILKNKENDNMELFDAAMQMADAMRLES